VPGAIAPVAPCYVTVLVQARCVVFPLLSGYIYAVDVDPCHRFTASSVMSRSEWHHFPPSFLQVIDVMDLAVTVDMLMQNYPNFTVYWAEIQTVSWPEHWTNEICCFSWHYCNHLSRSQWACTLSCPSEDKKVIKNVTSCCKQLSHIWKVTEFWLSLVKRLNLGNGLIDITELCIPNISLSVSTAIFLVNLG